MPSLYERAHEVALFTQRKIARLQRAYVGKGSDAADARASLARLRRLGMPGGTSWASVGEDLFEGLLDLDLSEADEKRVLRAITAALRLYAYHQQSKDSPMAITSSPGETGARRRSFGWSCRRIEYDKDKAKGVRRRMASIEGVRDMDGIEHHMRALIMLMRDKGVSVDYYQLARDLFLLQFPSARDNVFIRWGRDYFTTVSDETTTDEVADASAAKKN